MSEIISSSKKTAGSRFVEPKSITDALKRALMERYVFELDISPNEADPDNKKTSMRSEHKHMHSSYSSSSTQRAILYAVERYSGIGTLAFQSKDEEIIKNLELLASMYGAIQVRYRYFIGAKDYAIVLNQRLDCPKIIFGDTLEEALANARK